MIPRKQRPQRVGAGGGGKADAWRAKEAKEAREAKMAAMRARRARAKLAMAAKQAAAKRGKAVQKGQADDEGDEGEEDDEGDDDEGQAAADDCDLTLTQTGQSQGDEVPADDDEGDEGDEDDEGDAGSEGGNCTATDDDADGLMDMLKGATKVKDMKKILAAVLKSSASMKKKLKKAEARVVIHTERDHYTPEQLAAMTNQELEAYEDELDEENPYPDDTEGKYKTFLKTFLYFQKRLFVSCTCS